MTTGIAMPSWSSGFIGVVKGSLEIFDEIFEYVKSYCYIDDLDLVKVPKYKRTCVIRGVRRILDKYTEVVDRVLIYVDIYGVLNELCTKYGVNRMLLLSKAYTYTIQILTNLNIINDELFLDSEFGSHISNLNNLKISITDEYSIVKVARFIASLPEVCQCSASDKYSRKFSLDSEEFIVRFYDIKDILYRKILEDISNILHKVS